MSKTKAGRVTLPAGFTPIQTGDFAPKWDFHKEPTLSGFLEEIKAVPKGGKIKKDTRIMTVKRSDGTLVSVWESASIRAVFDEASKGACEVAFAYSGEKKIPGQKMPMHVIEGGVKPLLKKRGK